MDDQPMARGIALRMHDAIILACEQYRRTRGDKQRVFLETLNMEGFDVVPLPARAFGALLSDEQRGTR